MNVAHRVVKGITRLFDTHVPPIFQAVDFENNSREIDIDRFARIDKHNIFKMQPCVSFTPS